MGAVGSSLGAGGGSAGAHLGGWFAGSTGTAWGSMGTAGESMGAVGGALGSSARAQSRQLGMALGGLPSHPSLPGGAAEGPGGLAGGLMGGPGGLMGGLFGGLMGLLNHYVAPAEQQVAEQDTTALTTALTGDAPGLEMSWSGPPSPPPHAAGLPARAGGVGAGALPGATPPAAAGGGVHAGASAGAGTNAGAPLAPAGPDWGSGAFSVLLGDFPSLDLEEEQQLAQMQVIGWLIVAGSHFSLIRPRCISNEQHVQS